MWKIVKLIRMVWKQSWSGRLIRGGKNGDVTIKASIRLWYHVEENDLFFIIIFFIPLSVITNWYSIYLVESYKNMNLHNMRKVPNSRKSSALQIEGEENTAIQSQKSENGRGNIHPYILRSQRIYSLVKLNLICRHIL